MVCPRHRARGACPACDARHCLSHHRPLLFRQIQRTVGKVAVGTPSVRSRAPEMARVSRDPEEHKSPRHNSSGVFHAGNPFPVAPGSPLENRSGHGGSLYLPLSAHPARLSSIRSIQQEHPGLLSERIEFHSKTLFGSSFLPNRLRIQPLINSITLGENVSSIFPYS